MKKRTTINDIASRVGVSRQTVSRAINGMTGINVDTRQRIMKVVEELGYRPSRLARGMAGYYTQTIGVVLGDITNPSDAEIFQNLYMLADSEQYNILLRSTNHNHDMERKAMDSLIAENVDGIIVLSPKQSSEELAHFASADCPFVVIHRAIVSKHISSITTDTARATKSVVEFLMGAGHEQVGLVTRPGDLNTIRHYQGYHQALKGRGLPLKPNLVTQGEMTMQGGYQATHRLLSGNKDLTAITVYSDLMALGALKACEKLGRHVPDAVAIFGYYDIPYASYSTPTLSTIRINGKEVGEQAFVRIKEMIDHPETDFPTVILDIDLIIRESTSRS